MHFQLYYICRKIFYFRLLIKPCTPVRWKDNGHSLRAIEAFQLLRSSEDPEVFWALGESINFKSGMNLFSSFTGFQFYVQSFFSSLYKFFVINLFLCLYFLSVELSIKKKNQIYCVGCCPMHDIQ